MEATDTASVVDGGWYQDESKLRPAPAHNKWHNSVRDSTRHTLCYFWSGWDYVLVLRHSFAN